MKLQRGEASEVWSSDLLERVNLGAVLRHSETDPCVVYPEPE